MDQENLKYFVALSHFQKFGPTRLKKIKKHFSSLKEAFESSAQKLIEAGVEENIALEFSAARANINSEEIMEKMARENISAITVDDKNYPRLLKEIYSPPQLIYFKGKLKNNEEFNLSVVGSRKFTSYGKMVAEEIVENLARNNLTIVSGLALGIDSIAHEATLRASGRTIAVIGSGLDRQSVYPSSNRYLMEKIINSGGAVISEFPLGTPPLRHNFPQRNRIIAGLSLGTLVIEAGEKSGALITARCSLEQNREVFAVPGNIYSPASAGTNELIKKGAHPVTSADNIIEILNLTRITEYIDAKKIIPETAEEEKIIKHLSKEPTHINNLVRLSKLDTKTINSTLTIMEMKGMIKNVGNMQYVIAR
jgi:DNA processing protein